MTPMSEEDLSLKADDVYTLLGHASYLCALGQEDMPLYFFGLAARVARHIGDEHLAQRAEAICVETMRTEDRGGIHGNGPLVDSYKARADALKKVKKGNSHG